MIEMKPTKATDVANPFIMNPFDSANDQNIIKRHNATFEFIGKREFGATLDIGPRNPFTIRLEEKYHISVDNTDGDLDIIDLQGSYDTVFCLEVIEHLMNPLRLLHQINAVLKPQGSLFLSTPKHKPHFLWDKHHFTELDDFRLNALVTRAGFKIIRKKFFRTTPLWWHFTGFRPFFRLFFNRSRIVELIKDQSTNRPKSSN